MRHLRPSLTLSRRIVAVLALQAIVLGLLATGALGTSKDGPQVAASPKISASTSVDHDVSASLADLPAASTVTPPAPLELERQTPAVINTQVHDPAIQRAVGSINVPATASSFDGVRMSDLSSGYVPPDTVGDVGPTQYMQAVNGGFAVFSKTGTSLTGPIDDSAFWSGLSGCDVSATRGLTDPTVNYDQFADRWVYAVLSFDISQSTFAPSYMCVAVSSTGDATGTWNRYSFAAGNSPLGGVLPDYPKLGVWPDGYYISFNDFNNASPHNFVGAGAMVLDRGSMINGTAAQSVFLDLRGVSGLSGGMLPADADGSTAPPAGKPNYFVTPVDDPVDVNDQLGVWEFHVDWAVPGNSTFLNPQALSVSAYDGQGYGVSQSGTSAQLDGLADDRLMNRNQYRNFGGYETLVTNLTVDNGLGHDAPRWYELRKSGAWSVNQQSTFSPTATDRWMGSAAMDGAGDIALGYSTGDASTFPSLRYTGRLASDGLNTMQAEGTLIAGGGSQTGTTRWGDYSQMTVDPSDDCTFWYTGEYYSGTASANWRTRIGSFRFPSCATASGPTNTVVPTTSGTPLEGNTVTSTAGTWSPAPTQTNYQWRRCDDNGVSCYDIVGATASTYLLQAADAGYRLRSKVTVTAVTGTSSAVSAATGTVLPNPPVNNTLPSITGTTQIGRTLTAVNGSWSTYAGAPNDFFYQWQRCANGCAPIPGANGSTYTLGGSDSGATIQVDVTASTIGGSTSALSSAVGPITLPPAPANVVPPSVTGTPVVNLTLTAQLGTWSGVAPITYTFQWQTCSAGGTNCVAIAGQTGATLQVRAGDVGNRLRVMVTANNAGGASSANTPVSEIVTTPPSSGGGGGGGGGPSPDLSVTGVASRAASLPGENVTFAMTVTDKNGVMAQQLMLTADLSAGLQYVSATVDRGSGCAPVTASQLKCNLDFLSSNAPVAHVQITAKVVATGLQTLTATATSGQGELAPADNTFSVALNSTSSSSNGAPNGLNGDGTPTKKQDKKAPSSRALASTGRRGRAAQLRFKVYDDNGVAKVMTTVKRHGVVLGRATTGYGPVAYGSVYFLGWKVPARVAKGNYSFCVEAVDRAGNKSAQTCAPLAIK